MKRILLLAIILATFGTAVFAAGTCTNNTLSNLMGTEAGGSPYYCDMGSLRFSNFSFFWGNGSDADPTRAANVTVTTVEESGRVGFRFSGNSAQPWSVSQLPMTFTILFTVTGIAPATNTTGHAVTLIDPQVPEDLDGNPAGMISDATEVSPLGNPASIFISNYTAPTRVRAYTPTGSVSIRDKVTLNTAMDSASLAGLQHTFSSDAVPEPMSFVLAGAGLLALGLLRRRKTA